MCHAEFDIHLFVAQAFLKVGLCFCHWVPLCGFAIAFVSGPLALFRPWPLLLLGTLVLGLLSSGGGPKSAGGRWTTAFKRRLAQAWVL